MAGFLNNRHYLAQYGIFASVDPLVVQTRQPYVYGSANPLTLSDPSGLEPCYYARERGQANACRDEYRDQAIALGRTSQLTQRQLESIDTETLATLVEQQLYNCSTDWFRCQRDVWRPDEAWNLDDPFGAAAYEATRLAYLHYMTLRTSGNVKLYGGTIQNPDVRLYMENHVSVVDGTVTVSTGFFESRGLFEGCGFACAVATITTGLFASGVAGRACVASLGFACGASAIAASGVTSVVYEATSRNDEDGGDLVCAFLFGPSDTGATATVIAAGGAFSVGAYATEGAREAARQGLNSIVLGLGQTGAATQLC